MGDSVSLLCRLICRMILGRNEDDEDKFHKRRDDIVLVVLGSNDQIGMVSVVPVPGALLLGLAGFGTMGLFNRAGKGCKMI